MLVDFWLIVFLVDFFFLFCAYFFFPAWSDELFVPHPPLNQQFCVGDSRACARKSTYGSYVPSVHSAGKCQPENNSTVAETGTPPQTAATLVPACTPPPIFHRRYVSSRQRLRI